MSYKEITATEEIIKDKIVLLRSSLNVDIGNTGQIEEAIRLDRAISYIKKIAPAAKKILIIGHLGRPDGYEAHLSFKNSIYPYIKSRISELELLPDLTKNSRKFFTESSSKLFLLENIRFFKAEQSDAKESNEKFAELLALISDIFINDAFPAYRKSVSTYTIANFLPCYIGETYKAEIEALDNFKSNPKRPFLVIVGGAKLSEKIDTLNLLGEKADKILVGGAIAYTLLLAKGVQVGNSLVELKKLDVAKQILKEFGNKIILPVDHLVSEMFDINSKYEYISSQQIPDNKFGIDIGTQTIELFRSEIRKSSSILWNGPLGVFEWSHSSTGTYEIGKTIEGSSDFFSVVGGGDTIAAIRKLGLSKFDHVSLGGGAMLSYLASENFPTLDIIKSGNI